MTSRTRTDLLATLARTSPIIFMVVLFLFCLLDQSYYSYYFFIVYIIVVIINWIAKTLIFKPIYNYLGVDILPILGLGSRPKNGNIGIDTYNCDFIFSNDSNDIITQSFGMPSGHSQIAWAIATYIICKVLKKIIKHWINKNYKQSLLLLFLIIIVISIATYISYSRVYIENCHTIQQVIVGGIIGIICGLLIYYYENKIIRALY